jgi:hypothetical protein
MDATLPQPLPGMNLIEWVLDELTIQRLHRDAVILASSPSIEKRNYSANKLKVAIATIRCGGVRHINS